MPEDKNRKYILTVKHNLRTFLKVKKYNIDPFGSFNTKDENGAKRFDTLTALCNKLQEKAARENNTFFPLKPENKLKKLFADQTDTLDPYFINEICEMCGLPIDKIYSANKISFSDAEKLITEKESEAKLQTKPFAPLSKTSHRGYFRDFYGYTLDHNPNEEEKIIKFKLSFFEDENAVPKAEYVFYNRRNEKQVFSGTPYYLAEQKAIAIEMSANDFRRYQYIYFCAPEHNSVIYKHGICVRTSSASGNREPDAKSFILTAFELPEKDLKSILPGLLKMASDSFYILAFEFDRLKEEKTEIKTFYEKYKSNITSINDGVYLVNELDILESTNRKSSEDKYFAAKCLATIKALSLAPNKIIYRNSDADYNYFKKLENIKEN